MSRRTWALHGGLFAVGGLADAGLNLCLLPGAGATAVILRTTRRQLLQASQYGQERERAQEALKLQVAQQKLERQQQSRASRAGPGRRQAPGGRAGGPAAAPGGTKGECRNQNSEFSREIRTLLNSSFR